MAFIEESSDPLVLRASGRRAYQIDLGTRRAINIYRLRYRSGVNGRVAEAWIKVPYGTLFAVTELLTRQLSQAQLLWYRLDVATSTQIAEHRDQLARAVDALHATTFKTKVVWDA